jgi:hypothetical protein
MKRSLLFSLGLIALSLSACGGGGSGSSSSPSLPKTTSGNHYPLQSALSSFNSSNNSFNLTGKDSSGNTYTAAVNGTLQGSKTVNGISISGVQTNIIVKKNSNVIVQDNVLSYYEQSNSAILGFDDPTYNVYGTVTSGGVLPSSVQVGQTGFYYSANLFSNSARTLFSGTDTVSYEVDSDNSTPNLALVCIDDTRSTSTASISACYHVDTSGSVSSPQMRVSNQGQLLVTLQ